MNFYTEVKPVIEKYMNKAFRAYDGYGAEIVFPNNVSVNWEIDNNDEIKKVTIESDSQAICRTNEEGFKDALSMVELLAELELNHQRMKQKIDSEFSKMIKEIESEL